MIRQSRLVAGYDCIWGKCQFDPPCEPGPPGSMEKVSGKNHGCHGEEWIYVVFTGDRRTAIALTVFTELVPDTVPSWNVAARKAMPLEERREGAFLYVHHHPEDAVGEPDNCDILGGQCITESLGALAPTEFFKKHGDPIQFRQPEKFWVALENLLKEYIPEEEDGQE